jgi:YfiH family protein
MTMLTPDWDSPKAVGVVISTRDGGVSQGRYASFNLASHTGDSPQAVEHNRSLLSNRLSGHGVQWMDQVHGTAAFFADSHTIERLPQADAAWTDQAGIAIAVLTADCVPIVVADLAGTLVGVAHAGWRGLHRGVIATLVNQLPVATAEVVAWIGPAIGVEHYEVGEDVWSHFARDHVDALRPHCDDTAKRMLDLSRVAYNQLIRLGVGSVTQSGLCTFADSRFYSFRRQQADDVGETGRFACVAMLEAS